MFLMLIMIVVVMIFVAFAIDVGRIQLAQLKLQTAADLASRAGAEALARGVGDTKNLANFEQAIRDEADMLMQKNTLFGQPVTFDSNAQITFAVSTPDSTTTGDEGPGNGKGKGKGNGKKKMNIVQTTNILTLTTNSIKVNPDISQFPLIYGNLLGRENVGLRSTATARVQDRDIVVVLDRSTSMLDHDAGTIAFSDIPFNLFNLEESLYQSGDNFHTDNVGQDSLMHTEFEFVGDSINLSKIQAIKVAIYRFREIIDQTPGNEQLGLTTYSGFADTPDQAQQPVAAVDINAGLSQQIFDQIVKDGITKLDATEHYASHLEDSQTGYDHFDFNYLAMRWQGSTAITDGLEKGIDNLFNSPNRRVHASPIILLMTDGNHNTTHASNASSPLQAAQNAMTNHPDLRIYTVTFGSSADQTSMVDIANAGNGHHMHASNISELIEVFEELATTAGVTLIE